MISAPRPGLPRRAVLALPLAACARRAAEHAESSPGELIEVRDSRGFVSFTLRRTPQGHVFTDHKTGADGRIVAGSAGALIASGGGTGDLEARATAAGGVEIRDASGVALRLEVIDGVWRLADGAEIPRGRVRRDGAVLVAHDPSGAVTAQARVEGGRVVLVDRNGAALGFVTGAVAPDRAALAHLPGLKPAERALLLAIPPER